MIFIFKELEVYLWVHPYIPCLPTDRCVHSKKEKTVCQCGSRTSPSSQASTPEKKTHNSLTGELTHQMLPPPTTEEHIILPLAKYHSHPCPGRAWERTFPLRRHNLVDFVTISESSQDSSLGPMPRISSPFGVFVSGSMTIGGGGWHGF